MYVFLSDAKPLSSWPTLIVFIAQFQTMLYNPASGKCLGVDSSGGSSYLSLELCNDSTQHLHFDLVRQLRLRAFSHNPHALSSINSLLKLSIMTVRLFFFRPDILLLRLHIGKLVNVN